MGLDAGQTTSVLYVFDATDSTAAPTGADCTRNGSVGDEDDYNADGRVGDVLDCEIGGVVALNNSLAGTAAVQAAVVAFADQAAAGDLDPGAAAPAFVPPTFTGGDARPRVEQRPEASCRERSGSTRQRTWAAAGRDRLQQRPADLAQRPGLGPGRPKYHVPLRRTVPGHDGVLAQLAASGVKVRTFGVGADATCAPMGSLYKIASATGEACTIVDSPAALAAGLTG